MLSDALLAVNRFVAPLPMAQLWVLTTYYTAQVLILMWASRGLQKELRTAQAARIQAGVLP
jgi:hypothetical protein